MKPFHGATTSFSTRVADAHGDEGRIWLASLPARAAELADRWDLELRTQIPTASLSCLVAVRRGSAEGVLELSGPWAPVARAAVALARWAGVGAPALLAVDLALDALLLERPLPGRPADPGAGEVALLLRRLHVEAPAGLPALVDVVVERLDRARVEGRVSRTTAAWAGTAIDRLSADRVAPSLLHGRLDHRVLRVCGRQGVVAVDPAPCVGDPAYDAGHWVHGDRRPGRRARLEAILAATGLPRERVRDWAAVVGAHG